MRIYVASSWRNEQQPAVVAALRGLGAEVYDYKNPAPGNHGFHWSAIDPAWKAWSPERFREALDHPIADGGFACDMTALYGCDVCVLVLPSGRSAHLEAGHAAGAGKKVIVLLAPGEPELMYKMTDYLCTSIDEVCSVVSFMMKVDRMASVTRRISATR